MISTVDAHVRLELSAQRTPIYRSVDVLVCGGGIAGVAAAVEAARSGATTLLVERNVVLGGNAPLSFEIAIPPGAPDHAGALAAGLRANGDAAIDREDGSLVLDPEALKYAMLDAALDAGVQLLLATWAADPIVDHGIVKGVAIENKSGRFVVLADKVIDATGDGELAVRAGGRVQLPAAAVLGLNCRIGGIDVARVLADRGRWPALVGAAKAAGTLSSLQPDTLDLYGITETARHRGTVFLRGPRLNGYGDWDPSAYTAAELRLRKSIPQLLSFVRTVPGFEASFLVDVAGALAVTERAAAGRWEGGQRDRCTPCAFAPNLYVTGGSAELLHS